MNITLRIAGLIIAAISLTTPLVYAENGGNFAGGGDVPKDAQEWHHGTGHHHLMVEVLNLTQDQQNQLKELKKKQWESMKSAFEQIKSNREALNDEVMKASVDMNKVNDLQAKLKAIQAQMTDDQLNSVLAVKKVLKPEQFAGYMALKKERRLMKKSHHQFGNRAEHKCAWGKHDEHSSDAE